MKMLATLMPFALLLGGCPQQERAIPDPSIPHRLSRPVEAWQWVHKPDGTEQEQAVTIPEGYWFASPQIIEHPPQPLGTP